ncbi:transport and Golgi organization protein 6 homolog isoform X2 [Centropristis striata]|uniref:transport and Golgi organization protein 6 homolog isoform X2 n=1 Tax=Centropristis striata TaxID=184440 RepID=UPI0027DF86E0|nr:transport and Golgi organization protein 6 homolog isoform X2 [Centropristis striata]
MTSAIFSAINILTKPLGEASVRDAQPSHQEALLEALRTNRALLQEELQSESSFAEVRRLREEVMAAVDWLSGDGDEDAIWGFVQECLLLLLTLERHISAELELFKQTPTPSAAKQRTPEMAPRLPPDVLSVTQQKTLGTALQFVVSLGLCPYLAPGVGVSFGRRTAFGAMVETLVRGAAVAAVGRRLLITTNVLLQLAELSSLATLVFTRHLGDVMAALCQLGYQPRRKESSSTEQEKLSAEERQTCKEALKCLLGKVYQPIVIKELLILQGGPKQPAAVGSSSGSGSRAALGSAPTWLRRLCGQLLSERLMQPGGVQAVVRAILEGGTGGESDWRKCDSVAKILVTCPQQSASADTYYRQVCPQILDLLHFKDKLTAQQFQRVATRAVLFTVQEKPSFAQQYLLTPLLSPLHCCTTASNEGDFQAAVEEWELTRCINDVYKIWVVGNSPSSSLLKALGEILPVIFTLFCFTKQNVCHLRAPCQEILLWYLSHTETFAALSTLRQLSGLQACESEVAAGFHFTPGSDGGARLGSRESCSEEDDALYEKVSGEQWRLDCLMQLLAELPDCDLPGDFFLALLQELASWAAAEDKEEKDEQELDVSAMTLLEVEQQLLASAARQGQRLTLLQVLASMVESLQHTLLLRKTSQVVDFMVSLLQRACVGLDQATGPNPGNPVESQTLSMGMGLVATLLSEPQLSAEDYSSMSKLLPPLETLSQKHPEVVIQQLASNLRAVIATHGAYKPENFTFDAQPSRNPERTAMPNTVPFRNEQTRQTEANNSKTSPHSSPSDSHLPSNTHIRQPASSGSSAGGRSPKGGGRTSGTSNPPCPPTKPLSDWLLEACDPDVPTRAFALRVLTQMVQKKNPEAVQAQEKILMLLLENLEHEDSFVYLSAIQGLAAMADSYPERILERLLKDFQHGPSLPKSNKEHSLETRLKVGEVLMRASRAMGELTPHLGRPLVGMFLQGTRDPDQSVRASSLSNLGELCQRLDYALGTLAQELSTCLTALIKTEKEAEVRRAAVHVITLLLRGLSDKATQVLSDVLLDLYRALKWVVRSDPDDVAVLHAQLALEELDDVMRRFIFPEQKLEKKIVVLP